VRPARTVAALLFLHGALLAQATWVVTGGGPALQIALTAAAAGDILDVQPGINSPVVCSHGVRIALRPGARIDGAAGIAL